MKRVLIVGCSGAGKSTLARELSSIVDVPLVHLDHLFWMPGWIERTTSEFDQLLQTELEKECWIIEGNYKRTLPHRLQFADTVIFLNFNRWICAWRALKRWIFQQGEQAKGCPQKVVCFQSKE